MRRWLAVAALGTAFVVTSAWGQRGGHGGGGFGGHGGGVHGGFGGGMHGGFGGVHGFSGGRSFSAPAFGRSFGSRPFFGSRFGFRGRRWGWGRGWWPYYGWGWGWPDWGYDNYPADYYPSQGYADNYDARDAEIARDQQSEIDRLNDEVARLRDQRESQSASKPAAISEKTELIFNDKHTEEIQNYAIVGPTLWVLSAEKSRKIPLAELNLPATQKANDDRGVDFQLPR